MINAEPYLTRLTLQLVEGLEAVDTDRKARHAEWLIARQRPDGGWSGREGESDLYYTGFALRALATMQRLTPEVAGPASSFVRSSLSRGVGVVDFFSLIISGMLVQLGGGPDPFAGGQPDWIARTATLLETFRTPDGGYGKVAGAPSGSTYNSFLVNLCLELLGCKVPEPDRLIAFVQSRRRPDGGYVEIAPMKRSGTNPTAAGLGILQIHNALSDEARIAAIEFLAALPAPLEGGFRANDRIPAADLLSTFTGSWSLVQLGGIDRLNRAAIREYAESCEDPRGGFRGGIWDEVTDVEYTFYGLGVLALAGDAPAAPGLFSRG